MEGWIRVLHDPGPTISTSDRINRGNSKNFTHLSNNVLPLIMFNPQEFNISWPRKWYWFSLAERCWTGWVSLSSLWNSLCCFFQSNAVMITKGKKRKRNDIPRNMDFYWKTKWYTLEHVFICKVPLTLTFRATIMAWIGNKFMR